MVNFHTELIFNDHTGVTDQGDIQQMGTAAFPHLLFGFRIYDARLGHGGPFGECIAQESFNDYGSKEHVVGIEVDMEKLSQGYISQQAQDYGRVLKDTLGINCRFCLATFPEQECTKMIKPLEFVKSVKKEWTKEQCEEAIRKIAKVTGRSYVDHDSYNDEEDEDSYNSEESENDGKKKRKKKIDNKTFESYKKSKFLLVDIEEKSNSLKGYVKYDPKKFA